MQLTLRMHPMESLSFEYLKQPLPKEASPFPQVALRRLSDKYDEHISYLSKKASSIEARQDLDWQKELEDFRAEIEERKQHVKELIALNLREDSNGQKPASRVLQDREKARALYLKFVQQHPKG